MNTYRVNVVIQRADGPEEHSEVCLGNVQAGSIAVLVTHASTLGASFAQAMAKAKESAVADFAARAGIDPAELPCQP